MNTTGPTTKNGPAAGQGDGSSVPDPTKEQNSMSVAPATETVNHDVVPAGTRVLLEDGATAVVTAHRPGLFAHVVRLDTPDPDGHRVAFVARDGLKPIQHAAWCSPTNCHDDVHPHTGRLAHVSHGSAPHVWVPVPADPDARFESYLTRTDTVHGTAMRVGPTTVYVHAHLDDEVGVDEYVAWARKLLTHAEKLAAATSAEAWSDEPIPYLPTDQAAHDDGTRDA